MEKQEDVLTLIEDRFSRLTAIHWWDQQRITAAKVLVVGAGAIGNEVIKNLALLGLGRLAIVDQDCVEISNLTRSILFRQHDTGRPKAVCAAEAAQEIYPPIRVRAITGNVLSDVGLGYFRWADVVVGALDNREARVFVNSACARVGRAWIDGGIDVLHGLVRGFAPPKTACYECTMSELDWQLLNQRRSCLQLGRRAVAAGGTPTTPTTASVIGALQAQEVVKLLHGMESLLGRGWFFDGASYDCYPVQYPVKPDCPWHVPPPPIEPVASFTWETPLQTIADYAAQRLGGFDAMDFPRELVQQLHCPSCGDKRTVWQPAERLSEQDARCRRCGDECYPIFCHSLPAGSPWLASSAKQLGLPSWEIVWARYGEQILGIELAGDAPKELTYETAETTETGKANAASHGG